MDNYWSNFNYKIQDDDDDELDDNYYYDDDNEPDDNNFEPGRFYVNMFSLNP